MRKILSILLALVILIIASYYFALHFGAMEWNAKNVYGRSIQVCSTDPMTGFYRNGKCMIGPEGDGTHVICARVTDDFLEFSKSKGNDLISKRPIGNFRGLKDGECWCVTISRWLEAKNAGKAPPVKLDASHIKALDFVTLTELKSYAEE